MGNPNTRVVVLRACDPGKKLLSFHTHICSGKVAHFRNRPEVCMLFWDQRQSLQLRIYGTVTIHHQDETALKNLAELPAQQLQHYAQPCPPGSQLDTSLPEVFQEELIPQNFAWINVKIHTIDALHLGRTGIHTRLQYRYSGYELISAIYVKA
jgi:pyridoxine/pyridoxamine 5'-phosphate oxidase